MIKRVLVLAVCALAWGCGADREAAVGKDPGENLRPVVGEEAAVIAEVNGTPILDSDLKEQLKGGGSPREALQQLIKLELLAQEARRRGLSRDRQALNARRQAMAREMLETGFAKEFGPDKVPMDMVKMAYNKFHRRYNHAELVRVHHALVKCDESLPATKHMAARKVAREMHAAVAGQRLSLGEFEARTRAVVEKYPDQQYHTESITTDLRGRNVIEFTTAAFALKNEKEGTISPVIKTRFGYHVIRFRERIPARHDSLNKVEGEVRAGIAEQAKSAVFNRWMRELSKKYKVEVKMSVLDGTMGAAPTTPTGGAAAPKK